MGYIDDKAKEADTTIKGIGIVIFVVVWIWATVAEWNKPETRIVVILLGLLILGTIIGVAVSKVNKKVKAKEQRQNELEQGIRRYKARIQELRFDKTGKSIVYSKYNNTDDYYIEYIWKEGGRIWTVLAEPDEHTFWANPDYNNLSNLKKNYIEISTINYIAIEGNYCVMYFNWKPLEFRKDAINIFKELVPEKVK